MRPNVDKLRAVAMATLIFLGSSFTRPQELGIDAPIPPGMARLVLDIQGAPNPAFAGQMSAERELLRLAVSYTHLTLPTIYSV